MTLLNRQAGVLLHISSLPSGTLGEDAYRFVDFLSECKVSVWQTLPINMPHGDNSPYQCLSAHAGNPSFIDLKALIKTGLLTEDEAAHAPADEIFKIAYSTYMVEQQIESYQNFCRMNAYWLDDFALYMVIREEMHHQSWHTWPLPYKNRVLEAINDFKQRHFSAIEVVKFKQYLFFNQWEQLKAYAHTKKIQLFGDIPIFVAYDSADVWAKPYLFKLDANKQMTVVAGVPPDYFSATGQRWGNPHYHWQAMEADGYQWWIDRLRTQAALFDLVRIDHFRGLEAAWEIPATEETAIKGEWVLAPGDSLLATIKAQLPNVQLIAEDLGIITEEVDALRLKYRLPGMKILQFAFGGDNTNPYLPENIEVNSVAYTGTHDNDTTLGWYNHLEPQVKAHLHQYLNDELPVIPLDMIHLTMMTEAYLAIIPMQDILHLDSDCRMNTPGTITGNWHWCFNWEQLTEECFAQFRGLVIESGRMND